MIFCFCLLLYASAQNVKFRNIKTVGPRVRAPFSSPGGGDDTKIYEFYKSNALKLKKFENIFLSVNSYSLVFV